MSGPQFDPSPGEQSPSVLIAQCYPPRVHQCHRLHQQAIRSCRPILVVHTYTSRADLKLNVVRPWQLTQHAINGLAETLAAWETLVPECKNAKIQVQRTVATWFQLPPFLINQFVADIVAHCFFERIRLPENLT